MREHCHASFKISRDRMLSPMEQWPLPKLKDTQGLRRVAHVPRSPTRQISCTISGRQITGNRDVNEKTFTSRSIAPYTLYYQRGIAADIDQVLGFTSLLNRTGELFTLKAESKPLLQRSAICIPNAGTR